MSEIHSHTMWHGTRGIITQHACRPLQKENCWQTSCTARVFRLHCQRAHFQSALWKAASMSSPDLDPLQYGWEKKGQELRPFLPHPDSWLHRMRSSVVVTKLDAKQHSVLVLNSTLPAQSFANVCKPTAKIQ